MNELRGPEGRRTGFSITKTGLETPLEGRLWRETRLIFAPPLWYDILTYLCIIFGVLLFASVFFPAIAWVFGLIAHLGIWLGPIVAFAGLWGQMSSERMTCDMKTGQYARREGQGMFKRSYKGKLSELDAIVALAEIYPIHTTAGNHVVYRLVIHWKNSSQPLMVIGRENRFIPEGLNLNAGATDLLSKGAFYSRVLNIPFYDNSYYNSPAPQRPV